MSDEKRGAESDPVASFEALGLNVCVWSEKFGIELWLVPEPTGKDRIEITAEEAHRFALLLDTFGAEILELTTKDGRKLEPVTDWEERACRRKLLDHQVHYDLVLDREKGLREKLDDSAIGRSERDRIKKKWEREVEELNRLIEAVHGHPRVRPRDDRRRDPGGLRGRPVPEARRRGRAGLVPLARGSRPFDRRQRPHRRECERHPPQGTTARSHRRALSPGAP